MIRPIKLPRRVAGEEARYFQLMAVGPLDVEQEPITIAPAVSPVIPALIGTRRFGLMAIGSLDEEPEPMLERSAA